MKSIQDFKKHFYSGSEYIHLNNAGQALIPDVNRDLAIEWLKRFYSEGAHCSMEGWHLTDVTRQKLAHFLGAETEELGFFQTTASALSQIALSIPLQTGDEVLTWDQEYPSNFYPWREATERSGSRLIQVESENWQTPVQKILDRVNANTKIIAISWVQYSTGAVTDLKTISQALKGRGIWLVADVIQGVGVMPFDFHESGFDVVCGSGHKWLCSNYGTGFMVMKKERLQEFKPIEFGAMTYGTPDTPKSFSIQPKAAANRFEPGSKAMIDVIAMAASLDLFAEVGMENIHKEATRLADRLREGLRLAKYNVVSPDGPFVNFAPSAKNNLEAIVHKLDDARVSFAKRGPGIRLSVHAFNRDSEIDQVLKTLS